MSRSMAIGLLFGIVLTGALVYFAKTSNIVKKAPPTSTAPVVEMVGVTDAADLSDSAPPTLLGYSTDFVGSRDGLTRRAQLKPNISQEAWDRTLRAAGLSVSMRTTADCRNVEVERAISVPPHVAESVAANKTNVFFVEGRIGRCYGSGTKLTILVDDPTAGSALYDILGEATIERVIFQSVQRLPMPFLGEMGVDLRDLAYLTNLDNSPRRSAGAFFVLRFSFSTQRPIVDETKIPAFVPGAISLKPGSIKRYFENFSSPEKPVFIDARDRQNISSGEGYPGAIKTPFISSNPVQLRFLMNLPISIGAGAKFDLRLLPADRRTPLVIFGNDSSDAAPLWTIRYLRQLNYRTIFFVDGGLKALKEVNPPITL